MSQTPKHIVNSFVYAIFFTSIPLILGMYFLLNWAHEYFIFLGNDFWTHYTIISIGIIAGIILFYTRLRGIIILILLYILLQAALSLINNFISSKEIDLFFQIHDITIKVLLFFAGTMISYCLLNSRLSSLLVSITLVILALYLLIHSDILTNGWNFIQVILFFVVITSFVMYSLYIQKRHSHIHRQVHVSYFKIYGQSILFILFIISISLFHAIFFKPQIDNIWAKMTKEYDPGDSESIEQRGENGVHLNNESKLSGSNSRSNDLLLVAYIDHFFDGTEVPNPLYLTAFYYTHFDSATETFKRVDNMPDKDLFTPDPTSIPLYFTYTDSSVLSMIKDNRMMKSVNVEVYNKGLESSLFFAPSTAFSIQPIAVDKNFQSEYKNAYKSTSLVSELNSAFFVYNTENEAVLSFQKNRIDILKEIKSFDVMRRDIYEYYTQLPQLNYNTEIENLALEITQKHPTPIEKIIAIRDYFQSKDEKGDPLFRYSDNPGIPDLPSASKLYNFLFQDRSGYCAYYAGATLIMLRSLGIPSRVTVGFLTHDRSTSNKGWYYFYANQLHAWVQVYFPGYGWIDFDTTIGNTEARESPQPDGTPPTSPQKASLSIVGSVTSVDSIGNSIEMRSRQMVIHDTEHTPDNEVYVKIDLEKAQIFSRNKPISIQTIHEDDTASVVVFNHNTTKDINAENISEYIIPAERADIKPFNNLQKKDESPKQYLKNPLGDKILWAVSGILFITSILFLLPTIILKIYKKKSKSSDNKIRFQNGFYCLSFYLYQNDIINIYRQPPSLYFDNTDHTFGTPSLEFYSEYQKVKYSKRPADHYTFNIQSIIDTIEKQYYKDKGFFYRLYNKINFVRALRFLIK